jgi:hypothetical protein
MRSPKPYTNVTFTKRVDHEAGRHRGTRTPKGARVCEHCRAVYVNRRWSHVLPRPRAGAKPVVVELTVCPACRMAAQRRYAGELRVAGSYLATHRADIERLLQNEADRAAEDNPTGRIVTWDRPSRDRLVVTTTTEHLAKRLGHALHKACAGSVHYTFSHENKFAHVTWTREI